MQICVVWFSPMWELALILRDQQGLSITTHYLVLGLAPCILTRQIVGAAVITHNPGGFRSPRLFNKLIGTLFVGYYGNPFKYQECSNPACQSHLHFLARVTYLFPLWLLRTVLDLTISTSTRNGPHASLTLRAVIPDSSNIFRLSQSDDSERLQRLFGSRCARPNDLSIIDGRTALLVSEI